MTGKYEGPTVIRRVIVRGALLRECEFIFWAIALWSDRAIAAQSVGG